MIIIIKDRYIRTLHVMKLIRRMKFWDWTNYLMMAISIMIYISGFYIFIHLVENQDIRLE